MSGTTDAAAPYSCLWADANSHFRPTFAYPNPATATMTPGYPPAPMFQVLPKWNIDCDAALAQAMEDGHAPAT